MAKTKEAAFIGSIDQGTSSTRFIIYDRNSRCVGSHQVEFTQLYPQAGYSKLFPFLFFFFMMMMMMMMLVVVVIVDGWSMTQWKYWRV
jgi:glycerol kinase